MRLKVLLFILVGLFAFGIFIRKSDANQAAKIFGNTTYFFGNEYDAEAATLVNGVHEDPFLDVRYDNRYVYGDFNHDGLKDAAVIVIENNGGNTYWYTLAFLINDGKKLVHKSSEILDHHAIIKAMRGVKDAVFIDMFVHQEGDCQAGPTKRVYNVYKYQGPDTWIEKAQAKIP